MRERIEALGFDGGKTIVDDFLRDIAAGTLRADLAAAVAAVRSGDDRAAARPDDIRRARQPRLAPWLGERAGGRCAERVARRLWMVKHGRGYYLFYSGGRYTIGS